MFQNMKKCDGWFMRRATALNFHDFRYQKWSWSMNLHRIQIQTFNSRAYVICGTKRTNHERPCGLQPAILLHTLQQRSQSFEMGVEGELNWGDDNESEVFAEAQNHKLCIFFRYPLHAKLSRSRLSRIINCFHCLPVNDTANVLESREDARSTIYFDTPSVGSMCKPSVYYGFGCHC